jgi:PTH1 family peptidyl-tRNA hydrolase
MAASDSTGSDAPELFFPRLIVGLGNPGKSYEHTRHNIGFMVMDALAARLESRFQGEKRWQADVAKLAQGWLMKPLTYMNLSGQSVGGFAKFHRIRAEEILVVIDDVDLPLGRLRLRPSGSAGGHNGLKSLIAHLGTQAFPRLKVGIATESGRPAGERLVGHVLGTFGETEKAALAQVLDRAVEAVSTALRVGLGTAMNLFNRKGET